MSVPREVIEDLLPVYLAGEASAATRMLVEEHLKRDPELADKVKREAALESLDGGLAPSPDVELRALGRTRRLLAWQRRLYGFGIGFTVLTFTSQMTIRRGRIEDFHFLIRDFPLAFGSAAVLALICWTAYFLLRRRLRAE